MNTPVSFELAKLLKEKGFNEKVTKRWSIAENIDGDKFPICQNECGLFNWNDVEYYPNHFSAPTIAEVIMWLYEKHGIWVEVVKPVRQKLFRFNVDNKDNINEFTSVVCFNSPTEAYKAGIEYTLNNLI